MAYQAWTAGQVLTATQMTAAFGNSGWSTYPCTVANFTVGNGTTAAYYMQIGKTIHFRIRFTFGSTSNFNGTPVMTLPTNSTVSNFQAIFTGGMQNGLNFANLYVEQLSANQIATYIVSTSGAYGQRTGPAGQISMTTGNTIDVSGTYEAA